MIRNFSLHHVGVVVYKVHSMPCLNVLNASSGAMWLSIVQKRLIELLRTLRLFTYFGRRTSIKIK